MLSWLSEYTALPNVWGEGALFAFSGMDGETNAASQFVATYWREPYGLLFHTPRRRILEVHLTGRGTIRVATGDVYAVETPGGNLVVTFSAWHTIIGVMPDDARMVLRLEDGPEAEARDGFWVSEDAEHGDVLAGLQEGHRFALAYGGTVDEACRRARAGLRQSLGKVIAARLEAFREAPAVEGEERQRLLNKAVAVIRVNALAPEGAVARHWSTPDRVPHRHLWLWDSVFHSLAMNRLRPALAWEYLAAVLDTQRPDGMIPHMTTVAGQSSAITQPPILAWGVWENYRALGEAERLREALPRLERYLGWDLAQRDTNGNGLLEWHIEANERSRSGESGLDNSPRFDGATLLDAVDFSTFAAHDMAYLARIAREVGEAARADEWAERSRVMSARIHEDLWHEGDAFYYDREMSGEWSRVRAVTGFLPLLLEDLPAERVDALVRTLHDPAHFATAFPVPSVAASHPAFSTDMWRGATWLNLNYLIYLGLRAHGREEDAARLAETTLAHVDKYYRQYGVLFEFYDAQDRVPPPECERKGPRRGPYDIRVKMDSIRDYHWTAAVTALLLWDGHPVAAL